MLGSLMESAATSGRSFSAWFPVCRLVQKRVLRLECGLWQQPHGGRSDCHIAPPDGRRMAVFTEFGSAQGFCLLKGDSFPGHCHQGLTQCGVLASELFLFF